MRRERADDNDVAASSRRAHDREIDVYVAGTGSFAAELADWAEAAGIGLIGLIELLDPARVGSDRHGLPVVGMAAGGPGSRAILGVGKDRWAHWAQLVANGWSATTLVHPSASVASDVQLAPGVTIGPMAVIGAATAIAEQVIVARGALIGHHVKVGPFSTLNPGVNIGGNTEIGEEVFIGMSATVVNGIQIGDRATVAAGAVVLADVPPQTRVQGVPARPVKTQQT